MKSRRTSRLLAMVVAMTATLLGTSAFAADPQAAEVPKSPSSPSSAEPPAQPSGAGIEHPEGVVGDVNAAKVRQERKAANPTAGERASKQAEKAEEKAKASQTGNDATLRDLPSPVDKGSTSGKQ